MYASIGMTTPALAAPTQTAGLNTAAIAVFAIPESRTTSTRQCFVLTKGENHHYFNNSLLAANPGHID